MSSPSAAQIQWMEISSMMRQVLQKRLEMMDMEMLPEQWKQLVEALDTAMWVEAKAETYDELVESRRSELNRGTWGGG